MWENEHKSTVIRNILIFLALIAATAGLYIGIQKIRAEEKLENAALREANSSQRQELNDARQQSIDQIQQAYDADMAVVRQYLPGIICWGDSLTTGSSGNASYPYSLQRYINAYLCDAYDFRSTVDANLQSSRTDWSSFTLSIPVINMGAGQENSATILGRSSVVPYVVKDSFTIPEDTESVAITFTAPDGTAVNPLTAGGSGINPVTIAGVEGTLSLAAENDAWLHYGYRFTRTEAGEAVEVERGEQIITACADEYTDYIHIIWLGTYDNYRNPEQLVDDVRLLLSRQLANPDRYLVIGPCTVNGNWNIEGRYTLDTLDSVMLQAFGSHYISTRKYLIEDAMNDAGLTPSADDRQVMQRGFVPVSFRSTASGADLNGTAYKLIGRVVFERMDILGYFDEVRAELNISRTIAEPALG